MFVTKPSVAFLWTTTEGSTIATAFDATVQRDTNKSNEKQTIPTRNKQIQRDKLFVKIQHKRGT